MPPAQWTKLICLHYVFLKKRTQNTVYANHTHTGIWSMSYSRSFQGNFGKTTGWHTPYGVDAPIAWGNPGSATGMYHLYCSNRTNSIGVRDRKHVIGERDRKHVIGERDLKNVIGERDLKNVTHIVLAESWSSPDPVRSPGPVRHLNTASVKVTASFPSSSGYTTRKHLLVASPESTSGEL